MSVFATRNAGFLCFCLSEGSSVCGGSKFRERIRRRRGGGRKTAETETNRQQKQKPVFVSWSKDKKRPNQWIRGEARGKDDGNVSRLRRSLRGPASRVLACFRSDGEHLPSVKHGGMFWQRKKTTGEKARRRGGASEQKKKQKKTNETKKKENVLSGGGGGRRRMRTSLGLLASCFYRFMPWYYPRGGRELVDAAKFRPPLGLGKKEKMNNEKNEKRKKKKKGTRQEMHIAKTA